MRRNHRSPALQEEPVVGVCRVSWPWRCGPATDHQLLIEPLAVDGFAPNPCDQHARRTLDDDVDALSCAGTATAAADPKWLVAPIIRTAALTTCLKRRRSLSRPFARTSIQAGRIFT